MKSNSLWIFVICAFAILAIAWTSLIVIATKNRAEVIPVETHQPSKK